MKASAATKRPRLSAHPPLDPGPDRRVRKQVERASAAERERRDRVEFLPDVPDDGLHREREQHDADDHQEMRVGVRVAGERHAFRALGVSQDPLAADREEVEVGEPERGGDEEPEDRGHDLAQPDADPGAPIPIEMNASPSAMITTSPWRSAVG